MQQHWNNIYRTKDTTQVSWYQDYPKTSLELISATGVERSRPVLDVGGGDSRFIDVLLASGYTDITVFDIASEALRKAQSRLGMHAQQIRWVVADVLHLPDDLQVDIWHDRATFHFLRRQEEIVRYKAMAAEHINPQGYLVLGTFSTFGPEQCSGLPVSRYSQQTLQEVFLPDFEPLRSFEEQHTTPFRTTQPFVWTLFKKISTRTSIDHE
ncbi:MAG: class I SAM-dependent methyltransferase [Chloroflexi bacterium]|nr:class I SAM-dependent methyltransferase [Chloroflexota bacterium]